MSKIIKFYKNFGFSFVNKLLFTKILIKLTKKQKFREKFFKLILSFLDKNYSSVMVNDDKKLATIGDNYKVWVFWWQGYNDLMPELVKKCINSIKKNFKKHEVIVIDKENYTNYVVIPDYIIDKLSKGIITITHFSDIMRATLLSKYGGVWLDATCYLTSSIEDDIKEFVFYSNKLPKDNKFIDHVDKAKWSAFFLASSPNNPIIVNLKNILYEYWKSKDCLLNYFLVDYCIALSYTKFDNLKKVIDIIPENNVNIHNLQPMLLKEFDENEFLSLTTRTKLFKLSYKIDLSARDKNSYFDKL